MPQPSIPASKFVGITPGVLAAGGTALSLTGLLLTQSTRPPIGSVLSFASAAAVGAYFGLTSPEYNYAVTYFLGFDNSQVKPGALKFAQYPFAAVAGYQRGGNAAAAMTLTQLKAIAAAALTVTMDGGAAKTTAAINLSAATSFSNAATLITTALSTATSTAVCTFDAQSGAFVITSSTTGATSSISVGAAGIAASLLLTPATGLVTSPGAAAAAPASFMTALTGLDQNWGSFSTVYEPADVDALAFASWTNSTLGSYGFVLWDTDTQATQANSTTCIGAQIKALAYSGTLCHYQPTDLFQASMVQGFVASVDYTQLRGRATLAYRTQSGMTPGVTDITTAGNLEGNGYNYFGAVATRTQGFNFEYPGSISGPFLWADSYFGAMWLDANLQTAGLLLMQGMRTIPFSDAGAALIDQGLRDPIDQALNAGVIVANVPLSALQIAQVNAAAGLAIDTVLSTRGWYLQIVPANPSVRVARGPQTARLWYMDGQSVQSININSINVQ